jgi:hypothetical protein
MNCIHLERVLQYEAALDALKATVPAVLFKDLEGNLMRVSVKSYRLFLKALVF